MSESTKIFQLLDSKLVVSATTRVCDSQLVNSVIEKLDTHRGVMLTSRYEYPGRYTRFDMGIYNPPLVIEAVADQIEVQALNQRGQVLIKVFENVLRTCGFVRITRASDEQIVCEVIKSTSLFMEEDRSKMPHVMNVIRHLTDTLNCEDPHAGFYGAFGYDLGIDFMGVVRKMKRDRDRDLVLYFADRVFVTDHTKNSSYQIDYEFEYRQDPDQPKNTTGMARTGSELSYEPKDIEPYRDMPEGAYAQVVEGAKDYFARGDLFEVVPSQVFHEPCHGSPRTIFDQLLELNPAPYGALINLGKGEWTVSASPEMFVRVEGRRVESCPIAGTIARGKDQESDAKQINTLLESKKEESELTMCTDVDRNDKSRVCIPETIEVIGRRQIEMYSRLIHTVDHVEGYLKQGYGAIDAFMSHMWAVTVTGAPKMWAMNFIEQHEKSPRRFYGGAMGFVGLDGSMNTGLMLRTVHFEKGAAHMRVGATLLADSDPVAEEKETELKASAMMDVVRYCNAVALGLNPSNEKMSPPAHDFVVADKAHLEEPSISKIDSELLKANVGKQREQKVLLIDCEDSFVHTLAGYFRMCNANVFTRRIGFSKEEFIKDVKEIEPDLICLSPGPGSPKDFGLDWIIKESIDSNKPIFGVCLGLQALVEYFGGKLSQLKTPVHGKPSLINLEKNSGRIFVGVDTPFQAGRYHSLIADEQTFPNDDLIVTARTQDDGVVMAIEHVSLPIAAVQFHPESIMTMDKNTGRKIIQNVMDNLTL